MLGCAQHSPRGHLDDLLLVLEADRAGVHVAALVQVLPRRVDDVARHLAALDAVVFQLAGRISDRFCIS